MNIVEQEQEAVNQCVYSKCESIADLGRGPELLYMAKYGSPPVVFALIELPFLKFLDLIM